nr:MULTISPECIES: hypothetical protein [unclassified Moorella (in: firmicutes)]
MDRRVAGNEAERRGREAAHRFPGGAFRVGGRQAAPADARIERDFRDALERHACRAQDTLHVPRRIPGRRFPAVHHQPALAGDGRAVFRQKLFDPEDGFLVAIGYEQHFVCRGSQDSPAFRAYVRPRIDHDRFEGISEVV